MKVVVGVIALVVACGGPPIESVQQPPPRVLEIPLHPRIYHLPNGMKVTLLTDPQADLASVLVRVRAGAVDDPEGQAGVSHVAAHLSYAAGDPKVTLWDEIDRVAAWIDTKPDAEYTDFTEQTDPSLLRSVLHLEAERLTSSCDAIPAYWFDWLRTQVAEEIRSNTTRKTNEIVAHAVFERDDPYRKHDDADVDSVSALTQAQACKYISDHYAPGNTEIVVSGPIDPAAFEAMITAELGAVRPRAFVPAPKRPSTVAPGFTVKVNADVAEPTLVVAWPLPDDPGAREVMLFAADAVSNVVPMSVYADDHAVLLWMTKNRFGFDAAIEKVRGALRPGLVSPNDFEKARTTRVTSALLKLDAMPTRLRELARDSQLDAPYKALETLDPHGFDALIATSFDWAQARVIELVPDGTRSPMHPASLVDPPHSLRGPSGFPDTDEAAPTASPSHVLRAARTFTLPNGLRVMLVPSSPVPVVEVRLVVLGGIADEPSDHPGTSIVAAAAFDQLARRGPHAAAGEWAAGMRAAGAGFDTSGIALRGPAMYIDLLFQQLEGVAQPLGIADLQKGREKLVELAESPVHALWDRGVAVRGNVYGPAHPYARARPPTKSDVEAFDARAVEAFYAHYFAPDNAVLIVSGGFDPDAVTQLATRTFAAWTGHGTRTVPAAPAPQPGAFAAADASPTVHVTISWPAPNVDAHYNARHLLARMMMATSGQVVAHYEVLPQGAHYELDARLPPAMAARQLTAILGALGQMSTGDPRYKAAFVAARRRSVRSYLEAASLGQWTTWLQFAALHGLDAAWLGNGAVDTAHVTYDDVAKLAASELSLDRATFYVTGPRDSVEAVYNALGLTPRWLDP